MSAPQAAGERYLAAWTAAAEKSRLHPLATSYVPALDMESAYRLQHRIVSRKMAAGERVSGFKGGLMSSRSLATKGVSEPLVGALFASGAREAPTRINLCRYRRPALEAKLGYVLNREVRSPIATVGILRSYVSNVIPVAELPDIGYPDPKSYGAIDMVAANISSALYVRGAPVVPQKYDLDEITAAVSIDGIEVTHGSAAESFDGQWQSLLTVVNLLVRYGYRIEPGQIVLTGKIGDKIDLRPGAYHVHYGALGMVRFRVEACAEPRPKR